MKIEKISEDVIKITLSVADFETRNLDSKQIKSNSPQYEKLLLDVIGHAEIEFGFNISECRVVFEPIANKLGEHVITITRTNNSPSNFQGSRSPEISPSQFEKIFSLLRELFPVDENYEIETESDETSSDDYAQVDEFLRIMTGVAETEKTKHNAKTIEHTDYYDVLSFNDIENLISLVTSFPACKNIPAVLYRYSNKYFIVYKLQKRYMPLIQNFRHMASEFDARVITSDIILSILEEHGQKIIKRGAFSVLLRNFSK